MFSWNKNWKLIRVELYKLSQKLYKLDPVFITSTIMFSVGCIPPNILGLRLDCNQFLYRFLLIRKQHLFFKFNRSRWYKRICSKCLSTVDNLQNIRTKFFNIINMLLNMLKYVLFYLILYITWLCCTYVHFRFIQILCVRWYLRASYSGRNFILLACKSTSYYSKLMKRWT